MIYRAKKYNVLGRSVIPVSVRRYTRSRSISDFVVRPPTRKSRAQ